MKIVAYERSLPIDDPQSLLDLSSPDPRPEGRDLLVRVHAVSVNPVDTKVRKRADPNGVPKILGWDAAGVVEAVGADCTLFKPGDAVFYAGALDRQGSNSELHLVDERIVGHKPESLSFAEAAALPLTSITAWEMLFDRFKIPQDKTSSGDALLVIGGAGGVGSIAIQLARCLTGLRVIATASRPETKEWCLSLGAHDVINHRSDMQAQLKDVGLEQVRYIFSTNGTDGHWAAIAAIVAPQGMIGLIDDPGSFDVGLIKRKSASLHWEFMFTRSMFKTPDIEAQHRLLSEVARLVDAGVLKTTLAEHLGPINATNMRRAHAIIESGSARGKFVLEGFSGA